MLCKMSHEVTCSWFVSGSHGHWQIWASRVTLRDSFQEGAAAAATKLMYHFKKFNSFFCATERNILSKFHQN